MHQTASVSGETALRELLDREAIREVVLRYARGVDRRDLDLVASCFTSTAEYEGKLAHGRVADALAALRESLPRYESTLHFMGNQLVELRGDEASCETYAIAYHRTAGDGAPRDLAVAVRYLDELVRLPEGWRIRKRVACTVWTRHDPVLPAPRAGL
jgi:hypothetical protein